MSAPTIMSVTVTYPQGQSSLLPGQTAEVLVEAVDSDFYTIVGTITVTDSGGNAVTSEVSVVVADSLLYSATATAPEGQSEPTVSQHPTQLNLFYVTAGV